ncbi:MAG: hydroxyacylglutathione hydrolase [Myxococcales bacterium]|nr:hydroxyacylglutathione hydrolase [Myxococcales bacterium]
MNAIEHAVTQPSPPFEACDGRAIVHQVPVWKDNLVWLLVCARTGEAAIVDGPEAGPVLDYCAAHDLRPTTILNTHTHHDHIGINRDLARRGTLSDYRVVGPARAAKDVPGLTEPVDEGDTVSVGDLTLRVLRTEGHIDGHISYLTGDLLFCGDTLFAGGCGYLFDGPPAKMHDSLTRLAALPAETKVCCAHEYTEDNLQFAWSVDSQNEALADRIRHVRALRAEGKCTLPSTIGLERSTNPFLRVGTAAVKAAVAAAWPDRALEDEAAVFAAARALKDRKDYKSLPAGALPS